MWSDWSLSFLCPSASAKPELKGSHRRTSAPAVPSAGMYFNVHLCICLLHSAQISKSGVITSQTPPPHNFFPLSSSLCDLLPCLFFECVHLLLNFYVVHFLTHSLFETLTKMSAQWGWGQSPVHSCMPSACESAEHREGPQNCVKWMNDDYLTQRHDVRMLWNDACQGVP